MFRFSTCLTFRDNDSTRIRVFFFVSFILLTNFYRSSKIDGPFVYVCLYETFEDCVFTEHFSLP